MKLHFRVVAPVFVAVMAVSLSACGREAEQRAVAAEAKLAQMDTIASAKDSLMKEMISTNAFIGQLNDELHKLEKTGSKQVVYNERVMSIDEYRAGMMARVKTLNTRVQESDRKLRSTQARLRKLAEHDKAMTARIAAYDSMVVEYKKVIETQRVQIADLTTQVDTLSASNLRLANQVNDLSTRWNTVYMVSGTKDELKSKGIVAEVGGSRVLGIGWRTGETLVPARALHASDFRPLTKQEAVDIALPDPAKKYKLISRQNVEGLEVRPDKDGKVQGKLHVTDPEEFWGPSRFLILVEN
ncbi:MAG TPA: hypothetical protein VF021_11280 [Longimicrobiales bacterium]